MPGPLLRAHQEVDRAVDRSYQPEPFPSDWHRVEHERPAAAPPQKIFRLNVPLTVSAVFCAHEHCTIFEIVRRDMSQDQKLQQQRFELKFPVEEELTLAMRDFVSS